jgi:hypothetical protein
MKLSIIVSLIVAATIVGCSDSTPNCRSFNTTVVTVFAETCTLRAENPKCRVELGNGVRINVEAPILKGDAIFGCTYDGYTRLWRKETPNKIGLTTIGVYDN